MTGYTISKTFKFEFAHRVPTQYIKQELCGSCKNKCRHIHGHTGKISVIIKSDSLDDTGMVTDYTNLKWIKQYIVNEYLDHKTIMSIKYDTLWETFIDLSRIILGKDAILQLRIFRPQSLNIKILTFNNHKKLIKFLQTKTKDYELINLNVFSPERYKNNKRKLDYMYLLNSLVLINNYTTAETLAYIIKRNTEIFFNEYYNKKFNANIKVEKVCFYETETSSACV